MSRATEIIERASSGAYGEDSTDIAKVFGWLVAVKFDEGAGPFICGTVGKQGGDGLHDGYMVCPTYGADANCTAIFMRAGK
jgi:hypothetical protein